jgi:hypothetical protein
MIPFWKKQRVEQRTNVITAEEIHSSFMLEGLNYVRTLRTKVESIIIPPQVHNKLETLNTLGLVNTQEAKVLKGIVDDAAEVERRKQFNLDAVKFLSAAIDKLGENIILISYEKFFDLLEKYNLVCGECSDYTGNVPEENLEAMSKGLKVVENEIRNDIQKRTNYGTVRLWRNSFAKGLPGIKKITSITLRSYAHEDNLGEFRKYEPIIARFPFMIEDTFLPEGYENADGGLYSNDWAHCFYCAFDSASGRLKHKNCKPLLMCGPANEMTHILEIEKEIIPEDPFAITPTKFGILIHTMWGVESKDEILEKYKGLTDLMTKIKQTIG